MPSADGGLEPEASRLALDAEHCKLRVEPGKRRLSLPGGHLMRTLVRGGEFDSVGKV